MILAAALFSCSSYYNHRGVYSEVKGDHQKALVFFLKALKRSPANATYNGNAGMALFHLKQYDQAISYLTSATKLKPGKYHYLHFNYLGWSYLMKREYARAISSFKKSVELKPDFPYALAGMGASYLANKDYELAREKLIKAETAQPDSPFVWSELGRANYYLGAFENSRRYFQKCLDKNPGNENAKIGLGLTYLRLGDPKRGEQYLGGLGSIGIEARKPEKGEGMEITRAYPGLPADQAGLREGNVIISINRAKINDHIQLSKLIRGLKPGAAVPIVFLRYNSLQEVSVTVGNIIDNPHFQPEIPQ